MYLSMLNFYWIKDFFASWLDHSRPTHDVFLGNESGLDARSSNAAFDPALLCLICFPAHIVDRPQGKHDKAVQLFERALSINAKALGDDHPDTVDTKNILEGVRGKNVRIGREARCGDQGCNKHPSYGAVLGATKMTKKE